MLKVFHPFAVCLFGHFVAPSNQMKSETWRLDHPKTEFMLAYTLTVKYDCIYKVSYDHIEYQKTF